MSTPRYKFPDAVVRTTAGHLVVAGGTQVDVLAPDGRSFRAITTGAARRWFPTATALPDGTVLIVGGYDERIRVLADAQIIIKAGPCVAAGIPGSRTLGGSAARHRRPGRGARGLARDHREQTRHLFAHGGQVRVERVAGALRGGPVPVPGDGPDRLRR